MLGIWYFATFAWWGLFACYGLVSRRDMPDFAVVSLVIASGLGVLTTIAFWLAAVGVVEQTVLILLQAMHVLPVIL